MSRIPCCSAGRNAASVSALRESAAVAVVLAVLAAGAGPAQLSVVTVVRGSAEPAAVVGPGGVAAQWPHAARNRVVRSSLGSPPARLTLESALAPSWATPQWDSP